MTQYRKKPVIIEAIQWNGTNSEEITNFFGNNVMYGYYPDNKIGIETLEGVITASVEDFIVRGVNGEFYPCKPDIFEKTYEAS